ncbi:MAG: MarR family transcriptional regulator [Bacteroidetes bacterium]|nr:MAG: MarR family transcriptional regulator [Bacteroidota bacterium]
MNINSQWQQYLASGGLAHDVTAFGVWLIQHAPAAPTGQQGGAPVQIGTTGNVGMAGILVGRLQRFFHLATKPLLKSGGLQNADDFPVLATLFFGGKLAKGHLLKQALVEPATGSEMLKRMKANGWLEETPHPEDGRSSLMALSHAGRQLAMQCFAALAGVAPLLEALSPAEQQTLLQLLDKLDAHHSHRHGIVQVGTWMQQGGGTNV